MARRRLWLTGAAVLAVLVAAAPGWAQDSSLRDGRIDHHVHRGLRFIYQKSSDKPLGGEIESQHPAAVEALAALAALENGDQPNQRQLASMINRLHASRANTTCSRSLRMLAYSRLPGDQARQRLAQDAQWLQQQQLETGGWGYGPGHPATSILPAWSDSINSAIAIMALDEARLAGAKLGQENLRLAGEFWLASQNEDGGWGLDAPMDVSQRLRGDSYGTTTAAGVLSLRILTDLAVAANADPTELLAALERGRKWLADHPKLDAVPEWNWAGESWLEGYYWLLARWGSSRGELVLDGKSWNEQLLGRLMSQSQRDGGWGDEKEPTPHRIIKTALALLTLAEGRKPLLVNQLTLVRDNPSPRAMHNFVRRYARDNNRPLSWQEVSAADLPGALDQCPLLYVVADGESHLPDRLVRGLGDFFARGGIVLVQPTRPAEADAVRKVIADALPDLAAVDIDKDHGLYNAVGAVAPNRQVPAYGLGDVLGARVIIFRGDFAGPLHRDRGGEALPSRIMMHNAIALATDGRIPKARYDVGKSAPARPAPPASLRVARMHAGEGWDACPDLFDGLSQEMLAALSVGVRETSAVDLQSPLSGRHLLWLSSAQLPQLSDAQQRNLQRFLAGGGTLFIDSLTGEPAFAGRAEQWLRDTLGQAPQTIDADDPLLTGRFGAGCGSDLTKVRYSRAVVEQTKDLDKPVLTGIRDSGRWSVIVSPYAVTCPAAGRAVWGIRGLAGPDARRLALNAILYAALGE
jgi:hypothetical protein